MFVSVCLPMWLLASSINSYSYIHTIFISASCTFQYKLDACVCVWIVLLLSTLQLLQLYYSDLVQYRQYIYAMHVCVSVCAKVYARLQPSTSAPTAFQICGPSYLFRWRFAFIRNMNIKRINKMKYNTAKVNCSAINKFHA